MKKIMKMLAVFLSLTVMICSLSFTTFATNAESNEVLETTYIEKIFYHNKDYYFSFFNQLPNSTIDDSTIIIQSIVPLYDLISEQLCAYLIDVCDTKGICAYYVVNSSTLKVIEYSEISSFVSDNMLKTSTNFQNEVFYYSPLKIWKYESENQILDLCSGEVVQTSDLSIDTQVENVVTRSSTRNLAKSLAVDYPTFNYILNVPDYQQTTEYVCINTSILNVIAYWDANGLPDLITGTIDNARAEIQTCLINAGGLGRNASIPGAVESYATNHGYYASVDNIWSPEFFDLQFEINEGYPCLVGFPVYIQNPHMTTGVGYNTIDGVDYAIVHDNHGNTERDVVIEFSRTDFVAGILLWDWVEE